MTSTDTLLPCPFCGEQPAPASQFGWSAKPGSWNCDVPLWRVHHVCGGWIHTEAEAIAAWNRRTPPTPATEEREAVDAAFHKSWCAVIDLLDRDYITPAKLREAIAPFVAAEILAAEANERARWADWARVRSALNHRWAAEGEHLRTERIALSSAYAELADAIERNEHGAGK